MEIRWLALDVDGVLTDGRLYVSDDGTAMRAFHIRDGTAMVLAPYGGLQIAVISGRADPAVYHRMKELGVQEIHLGAYRKDEVLQDIAQRHQTDLRAFAFMGDDLQDLPAFEVVGYRMTVLDAPVEIQALADWVAPVPGGRGAVRAAIEHLLEMRGIRLEDIARRVFTASKE